jgi:hypothetical protein
MNREVGDADPATSGAGPLNALALFWGASAALVFFHFLPVARGSEQGWTIWARVVRKLQNPNLVHNSRDLLFIASLLTLVALVAASPLLVKVYLKSRLAWGLAAFMSGFCTFAIWYIVPDMLRHRAIDAGGWCLLAAPALNFAGLLALRPRWLTRDHPERNPGTGVRED